MLDNFYLWRMDWDVELTRAQRDFVKIHPTLLGINVENFGKTESPEATVSLIKAI